MDGISLDSSGISLTGKIILTLYDPCSKADFWIISDVIFNPFSYKIGDPTRAFGVTLGSVVSITGSVDPLLCGTLQQEFNLVTAAHGSSPITETSTPISFDPATKAMKV